MIQVTIPQLIVREDYVWRASEHTHTYMYMDDVGMHMRPYTIPLSLCLFASLCGIPVCLCI